MIFTGQFAETLLDLFPARRSGYTEDFVIIFIIHVPALFFKNSPSLWLLASHADLHLGRTQRLIAEGISLAHFFDNGSFRLVAVLYRLYGLVYIRIERLTYRRNRIQPFAAHYFVHSPVNHTQSLL